MIKAIIQDTMRWIDPRVMPFKRNLFGEILHDTITF